MEKGELALGVDLGGTKIEAIILDTSSFNVIDRRRVATEAHLGYQHILETIALLVQEMQSEHHLKFDALGIGTPGTLEPSTGFMKNCNTTCLNGKNLKSDLESKLSMKIKISNDANCFAVAEATFGAAANMDAEVVFGVILGTGVGGGVIVDRKVIGGLHGIGGEWGHNILEEGGSPCYCGKKGCVESVISGPALEKYYELRTNKKLTLKDIHSLYQKGDDQAACDTMQRLFSNFGKAISVIINILDPQAIIIGGGVGNIPEINSLGVEAAKPFVFNPEIKTQFLKPKLGDSAGVFGAALL